VRLTRLDSLHGRTEGFSQRLVCQLLVANSMTSLAEPLSMCGLTEEVDRMKVIAEAAPTSRLVVYHSDQSPLPKLPCSCTETLGQVPRKPSRAHRRRSLVRHSHNRSELKVPSPAFRRTRLGSVCVEFDIVPGLNQPAHEIPDLPGYASWPR
jgi:hypothetical protein